MEDAPRTIDFVPRRLWAICGWFVLGVLVIAGLLALYHEMPRWSTGTTDGAHRGGSTSTRRGAWRRGSLR
ncbi:MAG: hypothetical protein R3C10_19170 [Pirellulales bacterium]